MARVSPYTGVTGYVPALTPTKATTAPRRPVYRCTPAPAAASTDVPASFAQSHVSTADGSILTVPPGIPVSTLPQSTPAAALPSGGLGGGPVAFHAIPHAGRATTESVCSVAWQPPVWAGAIGSPALASVPTNVVPSAAPSFAVYSAPPLLTATATHPAAGGPFVAPPSAAAVGTAKPTVLLPSVCTTAAAEWRHTLSSVGDPAAASAAAARKQRQQQQQQQQQDQGCTCCSWLVSPAIALFALWGSWVLFGGIDGENLLLLAAAPGVVILSGTVASAGKRRYITAVTLSEFFWLGALLSVGVAMSVELTINILFSKTPLSSCIPTPIVQTSSAPPYQLSYARAGAAQLQDPLSPRPPLPSHVLASSFMFPLGASSLEWPVGQALHSGTKSSFHLETSGDSPHTSEFPGAFSVSLSPATAVRAAEFPELTAAASGAVQAFSSAAASADAANSAAPSGWVGSPLTGSTGGSPISPSLSFSLLPIAAVHSLFAALSRFFKLSMSFPTALSATLSRWSLRKFVASSPVSPLEVSGASEDTNTASASKFLFKSWTTPSSHVESSWLPASSPPAVLAPASALRWLSSLFSWPVGSETGSSGNRECRGTHPATASDMAAGSTSSAKMTPMDIDTPTSALETAVPSRKQQRQAAPTPRFAWDAAGLDGVNFVTKQMIFFHSLLPPLSLPFYFPLLQASQECCSKTAGDETLPAAGNPTAPERASETSGETGETPLPAQEEVVLSTTPSASSASSRTTPLQTKNADVPVLAPDTDRNTPRELVHSTTAGAEDTAKQLLHSTVATAGHTAQDSGKRTDAADVVNVLDGTEGRVDSAAGASVVAAEASDTGLEHPAEAQATAEDAGAAAPENSSAATHGSTPLFLLRGDGRTEAAAEPGLNPHAPLQKAAAVAEGVAATADAADATVATAAAAGYEGQRGLRHSSVTLSPSQPHPSGRQTAPPTEGEQWWQQQRQQRVQRRAWASSEQSSNHTVYCDPA